MTRQTRLPAASFFALASALMTGYILVIGKGVIVPVLISIIGVIVLAGSVEALRKIPVIGRFPVWLLHTAVLTVFAGFAILFGSVVAVTLEDMVDRAPVYQANLEALVKTVTTWAGLHDEPSWQDIRGVTVDRINLSSLAGSMFSGLTSFGGALVLFIVYTAFLLSEYANIPAKIQLAYRDQDEASRILEIIGEIRIKVSEYLGAKTAINAILGVMSFAILWAFDVDFAVFWAIGIAMLNYIPYVGSAVGVALPVLLSLAQYGNLWTTALLALALAAAQMFVGNVLEPRWLGRQLNLSPFAILLSLSIWSALWGVAGAILAIPLTSVMVIIFREFPSTRPLAIFISDLPKDEGTKAS